MDDQEAREFVARVGARLEEIASLSDDAARAAAEEAVRGVVALYGEGLARIAAYVIQLGGEDALRTLAADELVAHLLLLHGLHPDDVETRIAAALDEVRPYLRSHGGNVEFVGVADGVARLRLQGSCRGCPSSEMTLKLAIEDAIAKHAPDLDGIEAEGALPPAAAGPSSSPITFVQRTPRRQEPANWVVAGALPQLASDGLLRRDIEGVPVLFVRQQRQYFAYRDHCPKCDGSLAHSALVGTTVTCQGCGYTYDIQRAGRCLDAPRLHLDPLPLLVSDAGLVKVALDSAGVNAHAPAS